MSVEPKKRTFGPGICVWCGRCGEKSPLCSEACESDWATISADLAKPSKIAPARSNGAES